MKNPPIAERAGSSDHFLSARLHTTKPAARASNLKRFEKNTLRAFVDIELPCGLILRGCTLHFHERWWVGFPARPYQDQNGKGSWARIVDFSSKAARDRFQEIALEAAREAYEASQ
jgi:hypothetical protein